MEVKTGLVDGASRRKEQRVCLICKNKLKMETTEHQLLRQWHANKFAPTVERIWECTICGEITKLVIPIAEVNAEKE